MGSTWAAIKKAVRNGGVSLGKSTSFTEIESTNDDAFIQSVDRDEKVAFLVKFTSTTTDRSNMLTVAAGDKFQASKGALNYELKSTDAGKEYLHIIGPFESARFAKASTYSTDAAKTGSNVLVVTGKGFKTTGTTTHAAEAGRKSNDFFIKAFRMPAVDL